MRKPIMLTRKIKHFVFFAIDQYTLKVYRRKEWEAGVKHGIAYEQQRIIKLLEELRLKHLPWCGKQDCVKCEQTMGIEQAMIAITEGEK